MPEPDFPTRAIVSPSLISKLIFSKANELSFVYLKSTFFSTIEPSFILTELSIVLSTGYSNISSDNSIYFEETRKLENVLKREVIKKIRMM